MFNYYTRRVNAGTKIKKQQVCQSLFSIIEATHRLPIIKYANCDGPKCVRAVINQHWILFLSRRHARRASASCQTSFFCLHIIFFRHHSKIRRQLQSKADKTFFKVQIRMQFLARHSGEKKSNFPNFLLARSKIQSPLAIGRALSQSLESPPRSAMACRTSLKSHSAKIGLLGGSMFPDLPRSSCLQHLETRTTVTSILGPKT